MIHVLVFCSKVSKNLQRKLNLICLKQLSKKILLTKNIFINHAWLHRFRWRMLGILAMPCSRFIFKIRNFNRWKMVHNTWLNKDSFRLKYKEHLVELLNSLFVGTSFTVKVLLHLLIKRRHQSLHCHLSFYRKLVWFSENWFCLGFGRDPSLDWLLLILKPEHSSIISLLILTMLYRFNSRIWHHIQVFFSITNIPIHKRFI